MMRYVDEFRDPALIAGVAAEIRRTVDPARHYGIMEVCGGHTHAIYRHGIFDGTHFHAFNKYQFRRIVVFRVKNAVRPFCPHLNRAEADIRNHFNIIVQR